MTAPDPLREDEVEAVAREKWGADADCWNSWDHLGGDEQDALLADARAAILRLDQVREANNSRNAAFVKSDQRTL